MDGPIKLPSFILVMGLLFCNLFDHFGRIRLKKLKSVTRQDNNNNKYTVSRKDDSSSKKAKTFLTHKVITIGVRIFPHKA